MEIEIIRRGLYAVGGEVPVGTRFTVSQEPEGFEGFYRVVSSEKVAITNPARDPLDHDGDGRKGGSKPASEADDHAHKLRAEFKELTGKDADGRWKADRIQAEIDKALEA
mgnify:CR=1 FL=1